MNLIKKISKNPRNVVLYCLYKINFLFPDDVYVKLLYYLHMKRKLNLGEPKTFNEKLQWLKLYDHNPNYTSLVDKYESKKFVASIIGDKYIIPTLYVWDSVDEIDFDKLPNQFVLKTTQSGGNTGVLICKDKKNFDKRLAIRKLKLALKTSIYSRYREWPYKHIKPRIIAEKYITDGKNSDLIDYKFSCFNGVVDNVMLCLDRNSGHTKFYFFSKEWEFLRLNKLGVTAPKDFTLPKPEGMDKMFQIAEQLSKNIPYLRVDLYNVNGKIYFGELTFYPSSGFDSNLLERTDELWGSKIDLNRLNN